MKPPEPQAPVWPARQRNYWRDPWFWLLIAAGPLCWLLLTQLGVNRRVSTVSLSQLALIVVVYPILEEIVFRGGIQSTLGRRCLFSRGFAGVSVANLVTSLLFAAMHLFNQAALWAALVLLPSIAFGWAYDRYKQLAPPIVLHMFYNAGFVLLFA